MGKRYKKGNLSKRKKELSEKDAFFQREKELNTLIAHFVDDYFNLSFPPKDSEYDNMNAQRLHIKRMLDIQGSELYKQSRRRKRFYYKQLNKFKHFYVCWKHLTYYIFLSRQCGFPTHLSNALSFFKNISHDIPSTIHRL